MNENHQDKTGSNLIATENKIWLPPLSPKEQKKVEHLHKKSFAERMGFAGKTPWNLIQLLLIPLVLAGVGSWFSAQLNQTSLQVSERQYQTDLQIAADQQQETTLRTYLNDMSTLLLNNKLLESQPGDVVRQVARERTLTILRRLKADRNGEENRNRIVVQFLRDTHLIGGKNAIINLSGANLSKDDLSGVDLSGVNLSGVNLTLADLTLADLSGADLYKATLDKANLFYAFLNNADLSEANVSFANLSRAILYGAVLRGTGLVDTNLSGADLRKADLRKAVLNYADLSEADLREATLREATLREAILSGVDLSGIDLTQADLRGADLRSAHLNKSILKDARYNTKEIQLKDAQGTIYSTIPPAQWPQGFDPKAAGAIEDNTPP